MLGDLLRESFEIVYNTFLMTGVPTKSVTAAMRAAIFGGMYVLGDKVIENAVQTLIMYRDFLPHLMYADVYEDILALGLEHSYEKVAVRVIDKAIRNNDFIWPKDPEEADVLLNYFAYLCTCEDKRMENRNIIKNSKTIPDEKKLVVSKINPLWKLDESGIINKR